MVETVINTIISYIVPLILGYLICLMKSYRERDKMQQEALKCLLRSNLVNQYFVYKEAKKMPYYCKQNWYAMFEAYKNLGGNSFVIDLKQKIDDIEVYE